MMSKIQFRLNNQIAAEAVKRIKQDFSEAAVRRYFHQITKNEIEHVTQMTTARFLIRLGVGSATAYAKKEYKEQEKTILRRFRAKAMRLKGKISEAKFAAEFAEELAGTDLGVKTIERMIKANEAKLEKEIDAALLDYALKQMRKMKEPA